MHDVTVCVSVSDVPCCVAQGTAAGGSPADFKEDEMNYKKADTSGLPEGTDWNTLFQFSNDGEYWTKPLRCSKIVNCPWKYESSKGKMYSHIRPVTQWEPVPGEVYLFWDDDSLFWNDDSLFPVFRLFERMNNGKFQATYGRAWPHIARIDHLTKVPTSVEELKALAGEGNWL
jgi:rubredoxin